MLMRVPGAEFRLEKRAAARSSHLKRSSVLTRWLRGGDVAPTPSKGSQLVAPLAVAFGSLGMGAAAPR